MRPAYRLRGEFPAAARVFGGIDRTAGKNRGNQQRHRKNAAVSRHNPHPIVNGCPFRPFRQLAPELVS
jgi:hypothetical protein